MNTSPRALLRPLAYAAVAAALTGALWFLYSRTQGADFARENRILADIRALEAVDAEWTVDSLRAKTGLNTRYEPGQSPSERITTAAARVGDDLSEPGLEEARTAFSRLQAVLARKRAVTERFIRTNSELGESLRFVSDQSAEFLAELRELQQEASRGRGPAASRTAESLSTLGLRINELLTEILRYNLLSDAAALPRIDASLADLAERLPGYSPEVAATVQALIGRFRTVREQKAVEDAILGEIASLPTRQGVDDVAQALERSRAQVLQSTENYRLLLIAYSAMLLLAIAWFARRLVHSYQVVQQANAQLADANENLEHRVEERTAELADAIRHLKESEAALIQSEKMSSLGQMIAGVAHEINTPLAYVRNGLQVLEERIPEATFAAHESRALLELLASSDAGEEQIAAQYDKVRAACDSLLGENEPGGPGNQARDEMQGLVRDGLHGIDQISEIVTNLKNFSRLDRSKVGHFNLNEGLESTLVIARNLVKSRTIERDFDPGAFVTCSPSQVNQVFLNLITNAAQATGEGGRIRLSTRLQGDHVRVEVGDDGQGIAPEVLPRIFDPFFTTKKVGEGTGLGLSIAYKIVAQHGGRIEAESQPGLGTRFIVKLPVNPPAETPANGEAVPAVALAT